MTLEQRIEQRITDAKPVLEKIPGVVIIHYLKDGSVIYMSRNGLQRLQVTLPDLKEMGVEYHSRFFNPEDAADYVPKVLGMLERNNDQETISHFQQVKAAHETEWEWHVCGTRIFMRDDEGNPLLTISVAVPIGPEHYFTNKIERLLEENIFLRQHNHLFASLSRREKEILRLMAQDKSSAEMAKALMLSDHTVKTHRRNIKKKIGAENQYQIVKFAQAFNLL